jgi:hypothetical protein
MTFPSFDGIVFLSILPSPLTARLRTSTMTNYFYTDARGTKRGPCDKQLLKELARHGTIKPNTPLETDTGEDIGTAEQNPELFSRSNTESDTRAAGTMGETIFDIDNIIDIRFTRFITPPYISLLWCLALIVEFLSYGVGLFSIASNFGVEWMLVWFIPATLGLLLVLFYTRLHYEKIIVKFKSEEYLKKIETHQRKIEEHLRAMREKQEQQ